MAPEFVIAHAFNLTRGFKLNCGTINVMYLLGEEYKITYS